MSYMKLFKSIIVLFKGFNGDRGINNEDNDG